MKAFEKFVGVDDAHPKTINLIIQLALLREAVIQRVQGKMGEVSIEGTVLVVTPVQRSNQIMIQLTIGDPVRSPVIGPPGVDHQIAGLTIAVEKSLSQIPFLQQQAGSPRLTIILTEEEYDALGRPRYPDKVLLNLTLT